MWYLFTQPKWTRQRLFQHKHTFFFLIFTLFCFTILYWFCHTLTWIHHGCIQAPNPESPSHLSSHIISLDHPHAPAPSILYPVSNIDWHFVSYMIVWGLHVWELMYTRGRFMSMYGKTNTVLQRILWNTFEFFLIFIFTLFYFTILYWFCHTLTWIHHCCTCVPKHEPG